MSSCLYLHQKTTEVCELIAIQTEKTKVSYTAKDLVALAKQIKQDEKLEKDRQRLEAKNLEDELQVINEKEKLMEVDFFDRIASKCITEALKKQYSCQLLDDDVAVYEDLISRCGFQLNDLGIQNVSQSKEELPDFSGKFEQENIAKNSPWSSLEIYSPQNLRHLSLENQKKTRVVAIEWKSGTSTSRTPKYPGFDPCVLMNIASVGNKSFNNIFESIWQHIKQGKKKISFLIEEYEDGQCTADVISGMYFEKISTSLNEFQIAGVFTCFGYRTTLNNLKISTKDPRNLIRKIELKLVW